MVKIPILWVIFTFFSCSAFAGTRTPAIIKFPTYTKNDTLPEINPPPEEDPWFDVALELDGDSKAKIEAYQKSSKGMSNDESLVLFKKQGMDNVGEHLLRWNLEEQVINRGFKKIQKSNPQVQQISKSVEQVVDTKVEAKTEYFKMGTNADLLRRRARLWVDSVLFNTEAKMRLGSSIDYEVRFSRSIDLADDSSLPKINTSLLIQDEQLVSEINTSLTNNLNLSYQRAFTVHTDAVSLNYGISF